MTATLKDLQEIKVAAAPTAGQGLSLGLDGRIPTSVLPKYLTGIIPATGTAPTSGTGFTYAHTNGTGVYVFTFTQAFAATPTIITTVNAAVIYLVSVTSASTTGFTATTYRSSDGANGDEPFSFLAMQTV